MQGTTARRKWHEPTYSSKVCLETSGGSERGLERYNCIYSRNSLLDAISGDRPRAITAVMVGNCIDYVGELYETSYGLELSEGLKSQAVIGGVIRKHMSCGPSSSYG
jgi:hypothetical protein